MYIILSQKIDTVSEYADKLFKTYHFPSRYKNQIHEGDTFVYYQGNRCIKAQRYYFGFGTIRKITTTDGENYYASIISGQMFCDKVPIYLQVGRYVEQLGFATVRKSPNPPWQSSIRPLSQQAFDYIIASANVKKRESNVSIDELKNRLKTYIKAYYLENDTNAIFEIENIASLIISSMHFAHEL